MKKNLSMLMSVILLYTVVPVSATVEVCSDDIAINEKADATAFEDEIWVGGIKVTDSNKNDVFGDGGSVKYDHVTDTLTLTDATVINNAVHGIYAYGMNLTINGIDTDKEGSNSIYGKCTVESGVDEEGDKYTLTNPGCGIYVEGNGYSGNGGIVINGTVGDITAEEGSGISAYEDIIISGTVGDIRCTGGIDSGINSTFGSVIVENSGVLNNITSEEYDGIYASVDVIIKGKAGNINGGGYAGIHVTGGEAVISGNVESITGSAGGIEVYHGIDWDEDGNEVFAGGSVTISGTVGEISGGSVGIRADGDLNISGSAEVVATDTETDDRRALSIGGNIVLEPAEYQIVSVLAETYEDQSGLVEVWHNTVSDSQGNPVLTVKFKGFENPFEDVNTSHWYYGDVQYAVINGLFNGVTETTFEPNNLLTRAMLVTVLYRAEGEPATNKSIPFADIDMQGYYASAVIWAKQNNIVNGTTETTFEPNANITREQIAAITHRYAQYKGYDVSVGENTNILSYDDFNQISEYAIPSIQYASGSGLIKGKSESTVNPKDYATRAECAAILHRFIEANK